MGSGNRRISALILAIVGLLLVGCEAQATPIASISTETTESAQPPASVTSATTVLELRYGILAHTLPYISEIDRIEAIGSVEAVAVGNVLGDFDIVAGYGVYDAWQQSPISQRVSLVINPNLAPLTEDTIRMLIPQMIDSQSIVANLDIPGVQQATAQTLTASSSIRTTLANAGYPDGFALTLATESVPALDMIVSQFADNAIQVRLIPLDDEVLTNQQTHLVLLVWAQEEERSAWVAQVGENNVIDLWTMPISYLAAEGLTIEFAENGLPIPTR